MTKPATNPLPRRWLLATGLLTLAGALLHLAVPIGGPAWYAFLGAPPGLARMAEAGSLRPMITCIVIAAVLLVASLYAFSGAGSIRRLPLLRPALAAMGTAFVLRGLVFIPLALWQPRLLSGLCGRCEGANAFVIITSGLCLFVGIGYLLGAWRPRLEDIARRHRDA